MVSNNHVDDDEIDDLVNDGLTEHWDLLVACAPPDYYAAYEDIPVEAGTFVYPLPSDFYRLRQVSVQEATDEFRPLGSLQDADIQRYRIPNTDAVVRMRYIPAAPRLEQDSDTVDGVNGWEELIVLVAAIDVLNKRGQDPSSLVMKRDRFIERMKLNIQRDATEAPRVRRARQREHDRFRIYQNTVDGYILRAGNIELYRYAGLWAV